jgi:hypothetical protein
MMQQPQAYDSSLKTLLEGLADQVLPELVSGVEVEEELNDEMLKPPLRADRVYTVLWRGVPCILRSYLSRRVVGMYALLPTMRGASYEILKQALDEMKALYGENRRRFAEQLLLFDTFLQRTDTKSIVDKCKVQEYLDMFDSLLEESPFVQKKVAEAFAKGYAEGLAVARAEAEIEALSLIILAGVQVRFPALAQQAQQKLTMVSEPKQLHKLIV